MEVPLGEKMNFKRLKVSTVVLSTQKTSDWPVLEYLVERKRNIYILDRVTKVYERGFK